MPWISVNSTSIERLNYDHDTLELLVEFKGGAQYLYQSIPLKIYKELADAESIGSKFHHLIKLHSDLYPYEKMVPRHD